MLIMIKTSTGHYRHIEHRASYQKLLSSIQTLILHSARVYKQIADPDLQSAARQEM